MRKHYLKFIFVIFLIFQLEPVRAQNCYRLKIQKSKKVNTASNFYFKTVLDGRVDTTKILGEIYIGSLNIPQCAAFKESVRSTLKGFLQKTYTNKSAPSYLIKINNLSIAEILTKNKNDTGKVSVSLEFYKYKSTTDLVYITTVSKTIQDIFEDATYSHDNRLKRVFQLCINEFELSLKTDTALFTLKTSAEQLEKIRAPKPDSLTFKKTLQVSEKYKFIMQLQGHVGQYTNSIGLKIGALFFLKSKPKVGIGPSIFWTYLFFNKNFEVPHDVSRVDYRFIDVGLNSFTRLNKYLGVTLDGFILFGSETITKTNLYYQDYWTTGGGWQREYYTISNTTRDFIGGFQAEQGIQFMRPDRRGVNVRLSIYETFLSSIYYESDIGIKLSCGINF